MPGFDRTGPQGQGPMTGWKRGLCGRRRPMPDGEEQGEPTENAGDPATSVPEAPPGRGRGPCGGGWRRGGGGRGGGGRGGGGRGGGGRGR